MSDHEEFRQWMSMEVDGELDERRSLLLEKHLAGCGECEEERARLAVLSRWTRADRVAVPAGLPERILAAMQADAPTVRPAGSLLFFRRSAGVAAAALVLIGSFVMLRQPREALADPAAPRSPAAVLAPDPEYLRILKRWDPERWEPRPYLDLVCPPGRE